MKTILALLVVCFASVNCFAAERVSLEVTHYGPHGHEKSYSENSLTFRRAKSLVEEKGYIIDQTASTLIWIQLFNGDFWYGSNYAPSQRATCIRIISKDSAGTHDGFVSGIQDQSDITRGGPHWFSARAFLKKTIQLLPVSP